MPDGSKNGHLKNIIIDDNSKKKQMCSSSIAIDYKLFSKREIQIDY